MHHNVKLTRPLYADNACIQELGVKTGRTFLLDKWSCSNMSAVGGWMLVQRDGGFVTVQWPWEDRPVVLSEGWVMARRINNAMHSLGVQNLCI